MERWWRDGSEGSDVRWIAVSEPVGLPSRLDVELRES